MRPSVLHAFFLSAAIALPAAAPAHAQDPLPHLLDEYIVRTYGTRDGLPASYVMDLLQTREGYLYVVTGHGIARFDGVAFETIPLTGLESHFLRRGFEDGLGRVWTQARNDKTGYVDNGRFHVAEIPADAHREFTETADGTLWVAGSDGLFRVLPGGDVFHFHEGNGLPSNATYGVVDGPDGGRFVIQHERILRVETDPEAPGGLRFIPFGPAFRIQNGYWLYAGEQGLWIPCRGYVLHFDGRRFTRYEKPQSIPFEHLGMVPGDLIGGRLAEFVRFETDLRGPDIALLGRDGTRWYAMREDGADVLIRYRNGTAERIDLQRHLEFIDILLLLEDHEGSLWVATDRGLMQLVPRRVLALTKRHGLAASYTIPMLQSRDGIVWVGTWGGGVHGFADGRLIHHITADDGLPGDLVRALYEDRDGTLWVGTYEGMAALRDGRVVRSAAAPPVKAFAETPDGRLWAAANGELFFRTAEMNAGGRYDASALPGWRRFRPGMWRDIWLLHTDRDGRLWIGGRDRLVRVDGDSLAAFSEADGLLNTFVVSALEEEDGTFWFGTYEHGVHRYRNGRFTPVTTKEGLHSNGVWTMVEDDYGGVWMSSDYGLSRVDGAALHAAADAIERGEAPTPLVPLVFSEEEGLPNQEMNRGSPGGWRLVDGRMIFNNLEGAVVVDPGRALELPEPPRTDVQRVLADGLELDSNEVPPGTRHLAVEFTALSYAAPSQVRFRYRLIGYDDDWLDAGTQRRAEFTNLPPGRYAFAVQAAIGSGPWSGESAQITLRILPFFWQTAWFRAIIVILLMGGVAFWINAQRRRRRYLEDVVNERTAALRAEKETTQRQAEQLRERATQLAELDVVRRRFFANVSHEFRTPITNVSLILDLLAEKLRRDDEARGSLDRARANISRLEDLTDDILALIRLDADELRPSYGRGDLSAFLQEIAEAYTPLAERRRVRLVKDLPEEPVSAEYDPRLLERIAGNLLSNALKFTKADGKVRLGLSVQPETIELVVQDTGIGISDEHLEKLFDRFYQAEDGTRRPHEGLGLGLAVVREVAERLGGLISVESVPGMGSTFRIRLPRWAPDADGDAAPPSGAVRGTVADSPTPAESAAPDGAPRILIVEDNPDTRALLVRLLGGRYHVDVAANGAEALRAIEAAAPDLVVTDVMMPELDGLGLLEALRSDEDSQTVPVLLLTARADDEDRLRAIEAGADAYLAKPFSAEELLVRVENLLASRRRMREQYSREVVIRPTGLAVSSEEEVFLEKARAAVEGDIAEVTVGRLADALAVSPQHLRRKLREASGLSPRGFILEMRLQHAARLLEADAKNVEQTARAVGYRDVDTFRKHFKERFGEQPSEYRANG